MVAPDEIFSNPRLAAIYDAFDGQRVDLDPYLEIAKELKAKSILDVGCGTGCFATLLALNGFDVAGVDPAQASLDIAKKKKNAKRVEWILGDITKVSVKAYDLAFMTGNVAQVFITDESWQENLKAIHRCLNLDGHLVFETRNPEKKAWLNWTKERTCKKLELPEIGVVTGWCEVKDISGELVTFRWTYEFESDGHTLHSDSTLRFRDKDFVISSLEKTGFFIKEIRDAPDRPSQEFVFIAAKKE